MKFKYKETCSWCEFSKFVLKKGWYCSIDDEIVHFNFHCVAFVLLKWMREFANEISPPSD